MSSPKIFDVDLYNWKLGFQRPAAPVAEGIIKFHDHLFILLCVVLGFVLYIMSVCIMQFKHTKKKQLTEHLIHASTLEIIWTIIPALILVIIAIPSFSLLYSIDEIIEPLYNVKVVGHQWYWSYETRSIDDLLATFSSKENNENVKNVISDQVRSFDSYQVSDEDLFSGNYLTSIRQLTVDNHLFVPTRIDVSVLVTSNDVLHSWAVPSLGIKIDACPGRLNKTALFIKREGIYYGQCSELCGTNHGFMPIGIVSANITDYFNAAKALKKDFESVLLIAQSWGKE